MTIHYHGTPITPRSVLDTLSGKFFCVRYGRHEDNKTCHRIGQGILLDNGAFPAWRIGAATDWPGFYRWAGEWLDYRTTWAVIPDVIDGSAEENDALIEQWPYGDRGAPVWHMHEPITRLLKLAAYWPRVCIGSSGQYRTLRSDAWRQRMDEAMNALCPGGAAPIWIHMLRGMAMAGLEYPFASLDSTDIARNHNRPQNTALGMAHRWDALQCAPRWHVR